MMSGRIRDISIAIAVLAIAGAVIVVGRELRGVLVEIRATSKQLKVAAFESQGAVKAWRSEWESPEYERARLQTVLLGQQAQVALAQLNQEILPKLSSGIGRVSDQSVQVLKEAETTIAGTNERLNGELLPATTSVMYELKNAARVFQADEQKTAEEIQELLKRGQVSIDSLNAVLKSEHWQSILENADRASSNTAQTSEHLEKAFQNAPHLTQQIDQILTKANKFQKPMLLARLLATLAQAAIFIW